MVSPNLPELNLDLGPPMDPNRNLGTDFRTRVSILGDYEFDDVINMNDFISGLEDELRKIQAFQRELPLSCLLINDAIMKLKEKVKTKMEQRKESKLENEKVRANLEIDEFEKKSWMSSAQLWSTRSEEENQSKESNLSNYNIERGVFLSLHEDSTFSQNQEPRLSWLTPVLKPPTTTLVGTGPVSRNRGTGVVFPGPVQYRPVDQINKPEVKPGFNLTAKKQRRCWSPELHRRFVDALEKLGGSQVATPKQIRELMHVDGLTNDEVKSHLQKYRLHVRKLPSSKANPSSSNEMSMEHDQLELGCSQLDLQSSGSPESPLQMARSGKCNSTSVEEDEEKSDA